jgi:hypothetical protein
MAKTWEYRGHVIEEDFENVYGRVTKTRTGYMIRALGFAKRRMYVPGKYRTLAEAKRMVDTELKEGGWLCESHKRTG